MARKSGPLKSRAGGSRQELSSSLEDYLETVLGLVYAGRVARVRDIAGHLQVGMPSVSVALRALSARGLVNYDPYQVVTLTPRGEELGRRIEHRHQVLQEFLSQVLGLDEELSRANACRMEHAIDDVVLERLTQFARLVRLCPKMGPNWPRILQRKEARRGLPAACRKCQTAERATGPAAGRATGRAPRKS